MERNCLSCAIWHSSGACCSTRRIKIGRQIHAHAPVMERSNIEAKIWEIRYLPDLSIFNLLSVFVLIQWILNYYPNYPTHRLYFGEEKTPYWYSRKWTHSQNNCSDRTGKAVLSKVSICKDINCYSKQVVFYSKFILL